MRMESMIRKTLKIKDHRVVKVEEMGGQLFVDLEVKKRRKLICSRCWRRVKVRDRLAERTWRHVPLWGIPVFLRYRPARVQCPVCGVVVERVPWSQGKSPLSTELIYVLAI